MPARSKLIPAAIVSVVLLFGLTLVLVSRSREDAFRVGLILPMSGAAAQFGQWSREGATIAAEEIAARSSDRPLELIYEDSQNDPKTALSSLQKLLDVDDVDAIIVLTSSDTLAILPRCTDRHIVTFTGTILPGVTEKSPYVFRNATNLANEVEGMVNHLVDSEGALPVGVLYVNNDAGVFAQAFFQESYLPRGGTVVGTEGYATGTTDFRGQLTKILASQPEVLYLLSYGEFAQIMRQARELGFTGQFAGITTMEDPNAISIAGSAADGSIYTKAAFDPSAAAGEAAQFMERYQTEYGRAPELYAATIRDAVWLLTLASSTAQRLRGDSLRQALLDLPTFDGASGTTKFLQNRDVRKPVIIREIKDGTFHDLPDRD